MLWDACLMPASMMKKKKTKIAFIFLSLFCHVSIANEDDAILSTYNIIKSIGGIRDEHCITYTTSEEGQALYSVSVKERHDSVKCPGDKYTAPTIYQVLVDVKNKIYTINEELFKESSCHNNKKHVELPQKTASITSRGHSALFAGPIQRCKVNGAFLTKGDRVILIGEQDEFYKIEYESKRLNIIHAWIEKKNIQEY